MATTMNGREFKDDLAKGCVSIFSSMRCGTGCSVVWGGWIGEDVKSMVYGVWCMVSVFCRLVCGATLSAVGISRVVVGALHLC